MTTKTKNMTTYEDKHKLTREENLFVAKKEISRSIWSSVNLEGFNMTFADTETVLNHGRLANADPDAIICVNNLKRGWAHMLKHVDDALTVDFLAKINGIVAANDSLDPGRLRTGEGGIRGTSYKPSIWTHEQVTKELDTIAKISGVTNRALRFFIWSCKSQMWWDGNKRTSLLAANKILIEAGHGILLIDTNDLNEFNNVLHDFYEHDNEGNLLDFLHNKAICAGDLENGRNNEKSASLEAECRYRTRRMV